MPSWMLSIKLGELWSDDNNYDRAVNRKTKRGEEDKQRSREFVTEIVSILVRVDRGNSGRSGC